MLQLISERSTPRASCHPVLRRITKAQSGLKTSGTDNWQASAPESLHREELTSLDEEDSRSKCSPTSPEARCLTERDQFCLQWPSQRCRGWPRPPLINQAADMLVQSCRVHEIARRASRSPFGAPSGMSASTLRCVLSHTGTARSSNSCALGVSARRRLLPSAGSGDTLTSPRRSSGFSAAVSVVRSMARREATGPIGDGSRRFRDISREN